MPEFFGGVVGLFMYYAGSLLAVYIVHLFWKTVTEKKKGVLFGLALVLLLIPVILRYAPGLWAQAFGSGGSEAQSVLCNQYGGSFCNGAPIKFAWGNGNSGGNGGNNGGNNGGSGGNNGGNSAVPTRRLRADAIQIWVANLVLTPNDWLPSPSQNDLPKGVRCDVTGDGTGFKVSEAFQWKCYNTNPAYTLESTTFDANGYFTRESRSWNIAPPGGIANGAGAWEGCDQCWENLTPTAEPTAESNNPPAAKAPANNDPPPATSNTTWKVIDKSDGGAWSYEPKGDTCVGISQNHTGTIPFDTTVEFVQSFASAGWTKYLGSNDLALVKYNGTHVCIFKGTIKASP